MLLYHHHIPRTSGMQINRQFESWFKAYPINFKCISSYDTIEPEEFKDLLYLSGHLGNLPELYVADMVSFAIVRNPVDRFISTFKYFYEYFGLPGDQNGFEIFMSDKKYYEPHSNIQTKSLTGSIDFESWNKTINTDKVTNGFFYNNFSLSDSKIKDSIDSKYVVTSNNRQKLLGFLDNWFYDDFGFKLQNINHIYNNSNNVKLDISKSMIDKIIELNEKDFVAFEYVKSKEHLPFV